MNDCPLCAARATCLVSPFQPRAPLRVFCERCGKFLVSRAALSALSSAPGDLKKELARTVKTRGGLTFLGTEAVDAARTKLEGTGAGKVLVSMPIPAMDQAWLATPYELPTD
jgi:hypothetical protein